MLEAGASVNKANPSGLTPLMHAAASGHEAVVQRLLRAGPVVHAENENNVSAVMMAWRNGHSRCANAMVEHLTVAGETESSADPYTIPQTIYEACNGSTARVGTWLDRGGHINALFNLPDGGPGYTLLNLAAGVGQVPLIETLLARGASIDQATRNGHTPLMWAAYAGHLDAVRTLLRAGANPWMKSWAKTWARSWTARDYATSEGHLECAR